MTDLARRYPHRLFVPLADTRSPATMHEPAAWDPTTSFDDAVDRYSEWRDQGWQCWVIALDLPTGTVMDHTAEAHDHLRARLETRGQDLPAWMEDAA